MFIALIAAAAMAPAPGPAAAPAPLAEEAVSPAHQPAELDRLLAAKDYVTLGRTIRDVSRQADLRSDLDWLQARMIEGNSAFVSMLYSRLLWNAATGLPEDVKRPLRQTAVMATLYALAQIEVDGTRCGDGSAPAHRVDQLMAWNPEIWPFAAALAPAERDMIVKVAIQIEARTAARREAAGDVAFLCRAGLEETQYNLAHGTQREVPSPSGIGRTIELAGDGKYVPSQRPEADWRRDSAAARAKLAAGLTQLLAGGAAR
jgi:hypothetical protein